jgi:hypothetical protein
MELEVSLPCLQEPGINCNEKYISPILDAQWISATLY